MKNKFVVVSGLLLMVLVVKRRMSKEALGALGLLVLMVLVSLDDRFTLVQFKIGGLEVSMSAPSTPPRLPAPLKAPEAKIPAAVEQRQPAAVVFVIPNTPAPAPPASAAGALTSLAGRPQAEDAGRRLPTPVASVAADGERLQGLGQL